MYAVLASLFFLSFMAFYVVGERLEWIFLVATAWFAYMDRRKSARDFPTRFYHVPSQRVLSLNEELLAPPVSFANRWYYLSKHQLASVSEDGEMRVFLLGATAQGLKPLVVGRFLAVALKDGLALFNSNGEVHWQLREAGAVPVFLVSDGHGRGLAGLTDHRVLQIHVDASVTTHDVPAMPLEFLPGEPAFIILSDGQIFTFTALGLESQPYYRLDAELLSAQRMGDELLVLESSSVLRVLHEGLTRLSIGIHLDRISAVVRGQTAVWESRDGELMCLREGQAEPWSLEIQGSELIFWKFLEDRAWFVSETRRETRIFRFFFEDACLHCQSFTGGFEPLGLKDGALCFRVHEGVYLWEDEAALELTGAAKDSQSAYFYDNRVFELRGNTLEEILCDSRKVVEEKASKIHFGYTLQSAGLLPLS